LKKRLQKTTAPGHEAQGGALNKLANRWE